MWFDSLVATRGVLREPASSNACASKRQLKVCHGVSCSLPVTQDWTLVPGLTLRGMVPATRKITRDDATWWQVVSSFVRVLTCRVLLAKTLSEA
jgi:hypothetical protein